MLIAGGRFDKGDGENSAGDVFGIGFAANGESGLIDSVDIGGEIGGD